jgi:hypothetical protein
MTGGTGTGSLKEGWYEDPSDRHGYRWFCQGSPTDLVMDGAVTSRDPIGITEPAAFESMELKQPPDSAPLLQSGPSLPRDAYHVGAAYPILDPPPMDVQRWARRRLPRNNWGWWALAGVAAVFVGGLAFGYYSLFVSGGAPAGPASYLFAARTSVVYVQWNQPASSGAIRGTITFANLAGSPPAETVTVVNNPFSGQLASGAPLTDFYRSISLTINELFENALLTGTFQNGKLVLDVPNEGSFGGQTYVLRPSGPTADRAALQMLTAQKQRANKAAAGQRPPG